MPGLGTVEPLVDPVGLPPHDHAARRRRLRSATRELGVDLLVVTDPRNVHHLSGFRGSNGQLLLGETDAVLVTDARYAQRAVDEAPGLDVLLDRDWIAAAIRTAAALGPGAILGFEDHHVTARVAADLRGRAEVQGIGVVAAGGLAEAGREVKDAAELARIELACAVTDAALTALFEVVAPGWTEQQVARFLARRFEDLGAEGPAFDTIAAGGPNSAVPHHAPTSRPLAVGDLLKVDCGARVDAYHADTTRTVALGDPGSRLREVHALVVEAQAAGRRAATAGATGGDVDLACREPIEAAGLGDAFVHGTGHGVGLQIHEAPAVTTGSAATLRARTVLTVEPGVYLPGIGGVRVEDTVVVLEDGPARSCTTTPRDLLVL
ncbi:MAG: M24 family metallopeptidase [Actinomycetes bacterium]